MKVCIFTNFIYRSVCFSFYWRAYKSIVRQFSYLHWKHTSGCTGRLNSWFGIWWNCTAFCFSFFWMKMHNLSYIYLSFFFWCRWEASNNFLFYCGLVWSMWVKLALFRLLLYVGSFIYLCTIVSFVKFLLMPLHIRIILHISMELQNDACKFVRYKSSFCSLAFSNLFKICQRFPSYVSVFFRINQHILQSLGILF